MREGCTKRPWVGYSILLLATIVSNATDAQEMGSGKAEYFALCASCHGTGGKGNGPVAKALSTVPADLTKLSDANNGVFPSKRVYEMIAGRREVAAHGTREMPVWGSIYFASSKRRADFRAVVDYISTLQGK